MSDWRLAPWWVAVGVAALREGWWVGRRSVLGIERRVAVVVAVEQLNARPMLQPPAAAKPFDGFLASRLRIEDRWTRT